MSDPEIHIVPFRSVPMRLQEYGVGIFNAAPTKSALKKALKKGYVTVNETIATSATFIRGGETIRLSIPEEDASKRKLIFPLKVLLEDEHLAVIHKPAGILVSGNTFKTIANALPQNLQPSILSDAATPQPVHRLDYATTGVLLAGKTNSSIRALNRMFEAKLVRKTYHAVTIGKMDPCGTIASNIDGKEALSHYKVCQTVPSARFGVLNLVRLEPETGRRHQLRKHLASNNSPILGDRKYCAEALLLKGKGLYLHASSLEFNHPFSDEKIHIEEDLPLSFRKIFG